MNILITGVGGFLGEAIAREVSMRGHHIVCLLRSADSRVLGDYEVINADLRDIEALSVALQGRYFDAVIDCAAEIPRSDAVHNDYFGNVLMTHNLLAVLGNSPPNHLIKLSTVDVYKIVNPITEQSEILPDNYYSLSKRVSEQYVELWGRERKISACIVRLSQVFGPGDRSSKFIPSILQRVKDGLPIELFGDGSDQRDYIYVDDAAALIASICEKNITGILNIATGKSRSLNDVLVALETILDKKILIEYRPRKKPHIDYLFDIAKLNVSLKNHAFMDFTVALRATYAHMQSKTP